MHKVTQVGTHRGGGLIAMHLSAGIGEVHLIDPNRRHAEEIAELHRSRGRRTKIDASPVEDVLDAIDPEAPAAIAPDSLRAIRTVLEHRPLRGHLELQGLVRGTDASGHNVPLGLHWSVPPERQDLRDEATLLVRALENVAPPASSSAMRTSELAERRMDRQRERLARRTAAHFERLDRLAERDHAGDLFLDDVRYPIVLARGRPERSELGEAAIDFSRGRTVALAFLAPSGIDLVLVDGVGRGVLRAHVPLDRPRPQIRTLRRPVVPTTTRVPAADAAFTD